MRYKDSLWEYCLHLLYFFPIITKRTHTTTTTYYIPYNTIAELIEVESLECLLYMMFGTVTCIGMMKGSVQQDSKKKSFILSQNNVQPMVHF